MSLPDLLEKFLLEKPWDPITWALLHRSDAEGAQPGWEKVLPERYEAERTG